MNKEYENYFPNILDRIKTAFPLNNQRFILEDNYKEYSVLIPMINSGHSLNLLFEKRSSNLSTQPSEICFPGGRIEDNETPLEAAIRETSEELCIPPHEIDILGKLPTLITPFGAVIHTYVGTITRIPIEINKNEVSEIFTVPLAYLFETKPVKHNVSLHVKSEDDFPYEFVETGKDYKWRSGSYSVYFYFYDKKIIWGITAKILTEFIKSCNPSHFVL